jgi:hypothetical protein
MFAYRLPDPPVAKLAYKIKHYLPLGGMIRTSEIGDIDFAITEITVEGRILLRINFPCQRFLLVSLPHRKSSFAIQPSAGMRVAL